MAKRTITVRADALRISATIDTSGYGLASGETTHIREVLAERLMHVAAALPYIGTPLHRVVVK